MEPWLMILAGAVVFGAIFVYVLFMVFLPEWVGITGKVALKNQESHRSGEVEEDKAPPHSETEN